MRNINNGKTIGLERAYSLIKKPVITEKSTMLSQYRKFLFEVVTDTNKAEVKQAIEQIFKVKVDAVNITNQPGKTRKFRGKIGYISGKKIANVTLQEGYVIDVESGL